MVIKRTTTRTTRRASAAAATDPVATTDPFGAADPAPDSAGLAVVGGAPSAPSGPSTTSGTAVRVEMVDPATLLVDVNVRAEVRLDADFTASVRDLGVLVPVVAVRTPDGGLRVRFGHRRTLAAVQAALTAIPVVVVGDDAADDDRTGQVARLLGQWAENEHRTGLTTAERVGVVAQLAAFGVSPIQIARRTRLPRRDVDAALTIAKDDLAAAATVRYEFLDLLQAGTVAEFSDDPDAVKALVAAASTGQFDHVAQRLRDTRTERLAKQAAADVLRNAGVTVIERPEYGSKSTRLGNLTDVADTSGTDVERTAITPDTHARCPGNAACLVESWVTTERPVTDRDSTADVDGDPMPTESDDQNDDDSADEESGDADADDAAPVDDSDGDGDDDGGRWEWTPVYVCTDPVGNGHHPLFGTIRSGKPKAVEMTDDEREAARAERRDVIESNKAWDSATAVRTGFLRGLLARKTAPRGSSVFLATALAHDAHLVADLKANTLAAELFGLPARAAYGRHTGLADVAGQATEARASVIALGQVLAGYEAALDRTAWRNPGPAGTRYLTFLTDHGYVLSAVEDRARLT